MTYRIIEGREKKHYFYRNDSKILQELLENVDHAIIERI